MLKASLQVRLGQQLKMTPQLQQALRLLKLPAIELLAQIREALDNNIMLEQDEEAESATFQPLATTEMGSSASPGEPAPEIEVVEDSWNEQSTGPAENPWSPGDDDRQQEYADGGERSLREHLLWQFELAQLTPREQAIGRALIDAVNDDGYLADPLEEVAATLRPEHECGIDEIESVLRVVQTLDPSGVGARTLSECLLLQLGQLEAETPGLDCAQRIAGSHLEQLAGKEQAALRRELGVDEEEFAQAQSLVRGCHPRPGSVIASGKTEYVVPDVLVRRTARGWSVELNGAVLPKVRISSFNAANIGRRGYSDLRGLLHEANSLLKSLEIRNETLLKVARAIVERQHAFLEQGEERMQPMILRDIADVIGMAESTVSRVTSGKYMHTPRGVFELRYFFSSHVDGGDAGAVSSVAIQAMMRRLVRAEDPANPLSDARLAEIFSGEGIPVARRTVAKYREILGIAPSNERRAAPAK
jgi:RNA polymerase sigma-54 factor